MTMVERAIGILMIHYHAYMQEINRCLYIAGILDDKKAEEVGYKHIMEVIGITSRVTGKDPGEILKEMKARG